MSQRQIGVLVFLVALFSGLSAPVVAAPARTTDDLLTPTEDPVIPGDGGGLVGAPVEGMDRESIKLFYMQRIAYVRAAVKKVMRSGQTEDSRAKVAGMPGREVTAFSTEGATVLYTNFGRGHDGKPRSEIPGEAYLWTAPTSQGGLGGIGMELSTKAGIRGVYMEVTKFSFTTHDGVRVGPNTILAFNTFMYQRIGNAFFSSLVSANGNGEAISGLEDASNYQTLIDNFQTFENGPDELRNFVDHAIPEFINRVQEVQPTLAKKPKTESLSGVTNKMGAGCYGFSAAAVLACGFAFSGFGADVPADAACLGFGASAYQSCTSTSGYTHIYTTSVCATITDANGDEQKLCTTVTVTETVMIRP